ncbi:MAG: hypothetical protein J4428_04500 [Candidatus Aenigmarchaeota archaeon]|nr:hypothetical protein [Candidatus Aenigmarchaeota archaeon]
MIKFPSLGKAKEPEKMESLGKGFVPVDKVKQLSSKGFAEPEIIDVLRKEGFSSTEIDRALTQALKLGLSGEDEQTGLPTLKDLQAQSTQYDDFSLPYEPQQTQAQDFNQQIMAQPQQFQQEYYPTENYGTEELVESIVQERMMELDEKLGEFREKYANLDRKISDLHNRLVILGKGKNEKDQMIVNKLDSLQDNLADMGAKISSLEKTFRDALPALIESVRSLTELVQRFKKE